MERVKPLNHQTVLEFTFEMEYPIKTIEYSDQYRDDMIFMVLEARNALGRYEPDLYAGTVTLRPNGSPKAIA